jgi:hypothetical protein
MNIAMVWQPIPASARLPSGSFVERPCGQPEQKLGDLTGATPRGKAADAPAPEGKG